jgi:hypothetical protein
MLSRRQLLAASAASLPALLSLNACKGPGVPAVLSGPPPVSDQTTMLLHAVTAEQNLIWLYGKAIAAYPELALSPLLAEHRQHLARLSARVVEPPGKRVPDAVTVKPPIGATKASALRQLRAAEQRAVTVLLSRLGGASPSLAQLYASVAASEATHVTVLDSLGLDSPGLDSRALNSPGQS